MKILIVNRNDADSRPGGDSVQITQTSQHLEELGVQVDIVKGDLLPETGEFDLVHLFNLQTPIETWKAFLWARERCMPVVLSPIFWDMTDFWCDMAVKSTRRWRAARLLLGVGATPWLYHVWQKVKLPFRTQWHIQRRLLIEVAHILPNAHAEAVHLADFFYLPSGFMKQCTVVPNAVNVDLFMDIPSPVQQLYERYGLRGGYVLQVGAIGEVKNQLRVIQALYDVPVLLVFVGRKSSYDPAYIHHCHELAKKRGNVIFIDHLPHEQLPVIYAGAAVHVLPSWRETPGLASLEAAAAGCRVVSTCIGSAREYFGSQAWYCHPGSVSSIRRAVLEALNSPPTDALRWRVLNEFTWQRAARATLDAYHIAMRRPNLLG